MVGKKLIGNIKQYLETLLEVPVVLFDGNQTNTYPCVILGIDNEEQHPVLDGNYSVDIWAAVKVNGNDDNATETSEGLLQDLKEKLFIESIYSTLNKPLTGTDARAYKDITLEALYFKGNATEQGDDSTVSLMNIETFLANTD